MHKWLKFLTVLKSGGEYRPEHVYALHRQVEKHIPFAHFQCLSDVDLTCDMIPLRHSLPGWWSKLELFKQKGPVLYVDLDTMILGECEKWISSIADERFVILRDPYRGRTDRFAMGSGVMYWSDDMSHIWRSYKDAGMPTKIDGGDQAFIEQVVGLPVYFQDYTDSIMSYKADIRDGNASLKDATVLYFHGKPRPWNQDDIPWPG
jgi:hypothetical protein